MSATELRHPLHDNFDLTLQLVRALRKSVKDEPVFEEEVKGEMITKTNPAYVLLSQQEIHIRGLAQQIGPLKVEKDLLKEYTASMDLVNDMMPLIMDAPTVAGERHARVRNPYAVILSYAQTHLRGCNALLEKARTNMEIGGDKEFERLFTEPHLRVVSE